MSLRHVLAAGAVALAVAAPGLAQAATMAQTRTDLNLRTGPGTNYAKIVAMPAGSPIVVNRCLQGRWCEVNYNGMLGWASRGYLTAGAPEIPTYSYPVVTVPGVRFGLFAGPPDYRWDNRGWHARRAGWYGDHYWNGRRWYYDGGWYARPRFGFYMGLGG